MRGGAEEAIEPITSLALAIILAMVIGGIAYEFLDIMGREMSSRQPSFVSLQFAGLTAAVASAPQRAVYCNRIVPTVYMTMRWIKKDAMGPGVILTQVNEDTAVSNAYGPSAKTYLGVMAEPYPIYAYFDIRKNTEFVVAMVKNETGLHVFKMPDLEGCESLV